jgi:hypothetical protein
MAAATTSPRHRTPLLVGVVLVVTLVLAGCSSSDDDASSSDSTTAATSAPGTSMTSPDTTVASTGTSTTTAPAGPLPSPASSLPPSVDGPCTALSETYGLDQMQPENPGSWVDERQRIVVDAQREAALLGAAQEGAPADVAAHLATMQTYASWLATTVRDAADFSAAVAAVGSYPDQVGVSLAVASVSTWRAANCPT